MKKIKITEVYKSIRASGKEAIKLIIIRIEESHRRYQENKRPPHRWADDMELYEKDPILYSCLSLHEHLEITVNSYIDQFLGFLLKMTCILGLSVLVLGIVMQMAQGEVSLMVWGLPIYFGIAVRENRQGNEFFLHKYVVLIVLFGFVFIPLLLPSGTDSVVIRIVEALLFLKIVYQAIQCYRDKAKE